VHPILFDLGPITIYTYGVLLAAAYLIGLWMAARRAREAGLDANRVLDLGIWVIIAALVGAKALLFIVEFNHFTSSWQEFTTLLRSGGVFYGGLIAAVAVCIYQLRKHKLPLWISADLFAPGIALGYMVGRLGCLAAGCCYGKPTNVRWAITFTDPAANLNVGTPLNVPLHPTQLYESAAGLAIFAILMLLERRSQAAASAGQPRWGARGFPGRTFWLFVLLYSISRFVIEFYRGDDRGMPLAWLSTSQLISVVLAPLAVIMLWYLSRPAQPPAAETPARPRKPRFA
jgi:phosphatidylglycerol---prolipoprotein diacylglyceryl transferase